MFQAILDIPADEYYERFIRDGELVGWVPHLVKYKILERGTDRSGVWDWSVTYSETEAFGAVSGRDFCSLNFHRKFDDGSHICMTIATEHPDAPKVSGIVR